MKKNFLARISRELYRGCAFRRIVALWNLLKVMVYIPRKKSLLISFQNMNETELEIPFSIKVEFFCE